MQCKLTVLLFLFIRIFFIPVNSSEISGFNDQYVDEGEKFQISGSFPQSGTISLDLPDKSILMFKDNDPTKCYLYVHNESNFIHECKGQRISLVILSAKVTLSGGYKASLSRNSMSNLVKKFNITVLVPPTEPVLSAGVKFSTQLDKSSELTCTSRKANPAPNITWYFDNVIVGSSEFHVNEFPPEEDGKYWMRRSILTFIPKLSDIGKRIRCEVINQAIAMPLKTFTVIDVQHPPLVTLYVNPSLVRISQNAQFNCSTISNPTNVTFEWFVNTDKIPDQNKTILTLRILESYRGAKVICRVNNSVGSNSSSVFLKFAVKPSFTKTPSNALVAIGGNVTLTCEATGSPPPLITWYNSLNPSITLARGNAFKLKSVGFTRTGSYTCSAYTHGFERLEHDVQVSVFGPPMVLTDYRYSAAIGENVTMKCTSPARVVKPSGIHWSRYDIVYYDGLEKRISVEEQNKPDRLTVILTIQITSKLQYGKYNCSAWNDAGLTTKTVTISALEHDLFFVLIVIVTAVTVLTIFIIFFTIFCIFRRRGRKQPPIPNKMEIQQPNQDYEDMGHEFQYVPSQDIIPRRTSSTSSSPFPPPPPFMSSSPHAPPTPTGMVPFYPRVPYETDSNKSSPLKLTNAACFYPELFSGTLNHGYQPRFYPEHRWQPDGESGGGSSISPESPRESSTVIYPKKNFDVQTLTRAVPNEPIARRPRTNSANDIPLSTFKPENNGLRKFYKNTHSSKHSIPESRVPQKVRFKESSDADSDISAFSSGSGSSYSNGASSNCPQYQMPPTYV